MRRLYWAIPVLGLTYIITAIGFSGVFDFIGDTLLANEVRFDDREPPLTPYAIPASADNVQIVGGQGLGLSCSLPPGMQALAFRRGDQESPIALQMRQACAFHDYCYRHGNATYGYSQSDCDFLLQQQAFRLCKYITPEASIEKCETNARKVTLGVRLGGFGSFKRARAFVDERASTFFEFDSFPVRASKYRVVRVADAPLQWVNEGALPKAAYHFEIRPSGSLVHVLGWMRDGSQRCASFLLPAQYSAINGPPMVTRGANGEDWFVWWRRQDMFSTTGQFALLPVGRATREDWKLVAGGWLVGGSCQSPELWQTDLPWSPVPAAFVTEPGNYQFSEVHPVIGAPGDGLIRLMALSTHSCLPGDRSPCLVEIVLDTFNRKLRDARNKPPMYRAIDPNCQEQARKDSCDRYRNYVGAPYVIATTDKPTVIWMRRGTGNGDHYEHEAKVLRHTLGKDPTAPAVDLGERVLEDFSENREPAFILNAESPVPSFLSLVADDARFQVQSQAAVPRNEHSTVTVQPCMRDLPASWLQRPTFMVQDYNDPAHSYLVFARVPFDGAIITRLNQPAILQVAVATIDSGVCSGARQKLFPHFYEGFATPDEVDVSLAVATGIAGGVPSEDKALAKARETMGRYVQRIRGGQLVLADMTCDGVPELLQVAELDDLRQARASLLAGKIGPSGLEFSEMKDFMRNGSLCPPPVSHFLLQINAPLNASSKAGIP